MKKKNHTGSMMLTTLMTAVVLVGCVAPAPPPRPVSLAPAPPPPKPTYKRGHPGVYQNPDIKRVAVLPFGNERFTESVTEVLVNRSRWDVIDRATLSKIFEEQDLQHTDRFDEETAVKIGRLAGVDMVIMGDYRTNEVLVKGLDAQTAKLLVYRIVPLKDINGVPEQGSYSTISLLPHTIKTMNGKKTWWVGPTGDLVEQARPAPVIETPIAAAPVMRTAIQGWEVEGGR